MTPDSRYPIGRFTPPSAWDAASVTSWLRDIRELPAPLAPSQALLRGLHERWSVLLDSRTQAELMRVFHHPEQQHDVPRWHNLALCSWHGRHHTAHVTSLRTRHDW
jgi:DinB superfamily